LGQQRARHRAQRPLHVPHAAGGGRHGLADPGRGVHLAENYRRDHHHGGRRLGAVRRRAAAPARGRATRLGLIRIAPLKKGGTEMSHGHGHGGHDDHGGANKKIALLISVMALILAFAETLGKSAQTAAVAANIDALNLWNFFQAKTIRQTVLRTAAEQTAATASTPKANQQVDKWLDTAKRYQAEPETNEGREQLMARAKAAEKRREVLTAAYHHYETASAAVQIAIVMASASIVTGMAALVWIAAGFGAVAIAFCVIGFWFPTAV